MKLAGPASPCAGSRPDRSSTPRCASAADARRGSAGHVAVYACDHAVAAHLGELSVTSLAARGVAGCVLDGGCRDVRFIVELGFPVFCAHVTPGGLDRALELEATQQPVSVGQAVEPGDSVVGDDDGVVVVPRDRRERSRRGRAEGATEARSARRSRRCPARAYERYGTF